MADIKQIKLPDGNTYNVKAENAEKIRCDFITTTSTGTYLPLVVNSTTTAAEYQEMAVPNHGPTVDIYNGELKAAQIVTDFAAIGNTTDGYATISPTQSYFPNGIITGNVFCSSMNVVDISDQYSISKTSGQWSVASITAFRTGNVVQIFMAYKGNGSAVPAGGNGFTGTITSGPIPVSTARAICLSGTAVGYSNIDSSGGILARPHTGSMTLSSSSKLAAIFIFICA